MRESFAQRDAANYVGHTVSTLASRRSRGLPPRSWKAPNGTVRYDVADLDSYLAARKASTMRGDL